MPKVTHFIPSYLHINTYMCKYVDKYIYVPAYTCLQPFVYLYIFVLMTGFRNIKKHKLFLTVVYRTDF